MMAVAIPSSPQSGVECWKLVNGDIQGYPLGTRLHVSVQIRYEDVSTSTVRYNHPTLQDLLRNNPRIIDGYPILPILVRNVELRAAGSEARDHNSTLMLI